MTYVTPYRRTKFFFCIIIYILLTIADLLLTYRATPDLSREASPLVKVFGLGWPGFIIANVQLCIIAILAAYVCFIKYERKLIPCADFREYYRMLFYGRPERIPLFYWPARDQRMNILNLCCFLFLISTIFGRLFVVLDWSCYFIVMWRHRLLQGPHIDIALMWRYQIKPLASVYHHMMVFMYSALFVALFYWLIKGYLVNKRYLVNKKS